MPRDRGLRSGRGSRSAQSPWPGSTIEERETNGQRAYFETRELHDPSSWCSPPPGYDGGRGGYHDYDSSRFSDCGRPGSGRRRDFSPQPAPHGGHREYQNKGYDDYEDDYEGYTRSPNPLAGPRRGESPAHGFVSELSSNELEGVELEEPIRSYGHSARPRDRSPLRSSRARSPPRSSHPRSLWSRIFHPHSPPPRHSRHPHRPRGERRGSVSFVGGSAPPDGIYRLEKGQVYQIKRGRRRHQR